MTNVIVSHPCVSYICSVNKDTEVSMTDAMATEVLRCFRIRMEFIYISMAMPLNIYCIFSLIIHVRIKKHARILTNLSPFSKDVISQLRPSVHTIWMTFVSALWEFVCIHDLLLIFTGLNRVGNISSVLYNMWVSSSSKSCRHMSRTSNPFLPFPH